MQYHTDSSGPDSAAFATAFKKAIHLALSTGLDVIFLTHTLKNLSGVPEKVLGKEFIKNLSKNRVVMIESVRIILETERISGTHSKAVIFAPFVSTELLNKVIGGARAAELVYVPWAPEERDGYLASHPMSQQI